jgi:hypothetical protein
MNRRHFHHQPRSRVTAIGPIAHANEDDDQIETWMLGQGQEPRANRHTVVRRAWDLCLSVRSLRTNGLPDWIKFKNPEAPPGECVKSRGASPRRRGGT